MYCGNLALVVTLACAALMSSITSGFAQTPPGQQAGEVQTGPITEPSSAEQKTSGPAIPKGIQAISRKDERCSTQLIVNANALFAAGRWTLNSDATQTLEALAPLIVKAGKHPARIVAFTRSDKSDKNNQIVAARRALTVRTWLKDHGFVPEDTTSEGFGTAPPGAREPKERVEVVIDTCKPLQSTKE